MPVPLPPFKEQIEIVRRIEELFAWCDSVEAAYTEGVEKLKILPQSLLQKAFSGKLVAQDPNDEPASVLLERIKVEKTRLSETSKQNKIDNRKIKQQTTKMTKAQQTSLKDNIKTHFGKGVAFTSSELRAKLRPTDYDSFKRQLFALLEGESPLKDTLFESADADQLTMRFDKERDQLVFELSEQMTA